MNNLRHTRAVVYRLKRLYGAAIELVTVGKQTLDYKTGEVTVNETKKSIRYALVLPVRVALETFTDANVMAMYGSVEDANTRMVVIDRKDWTTEPTTNDYVEYDGLRWSIKTVDATTIDKHVMLTVRTVSSKTV